MKFAYTGGYIFTANEDGTTDEKSHVVCRVEEVNPNLQLLIDQANRMDPAAPVEKVAEPEPEEQKLQPPPKRK